MGYLNSERPDSRSVAWLRKARYAATCYLEHHPGPYHDVFDQLRGLSDLWIDDNMRAAAALYTPVIHTCPPEWSIEREYGSDIFDLLMETTYDPDLTPDQRLVAMEDRLDRMSPRGFILQFAVLKAYFERDIGLYARQKPEGDLHYCRWLERYLNRLADYCPRLAGRLGRVIAYHYRSRLDTRYQAHRQPVLSRLIRLIFPFLN